MKRAALPGKRLGAAATVVAATLVLAVQLITPSPVMVSIGENGAESTQLGQFFTTVDVGIVALSATALGASATYLVLHGTAATTNDTVSVGRLADATNGRPGSGDRPSRPMADGARDEGEGGSAIGRARRAAWEETLERLRGNEETVYSRIVDADGELPQREIVRGTDLSKATVSRTLDTLESKGLLERKRRGMGNVVVLE